MKFISHQLFKVPRIFIRKPVPNVVLCQPVSALIKTLLSIEGKTKEVGKVVSKYEEVFDVTVKYFEGEVDFVQVVTLRQAQGDKPIKTNISGSIEFMACNDEQCLPPKTVSFNVRLE